MSGSHSILRISAHRGAVILCFHRVSLTSFCLSVDQLLRTFTLVSLDELVARREQHRRLAGLLAITIDDGYADTCEPIAALCDAERWPVTIYLMSSLLTGQRRFWFGELDDVLRAAAGQRFQVDGDVVDLSEAAFGRTRVRLIRRLCALPGADAMVLVDRITAAAGVATPGRHPRRFVTVDFVKRYASNPSVSFGSHTVDHQALSVQSAADIDRQLSESRRCLEAAVGRPVGHFCYPYGSAEWIGSTAPRLVAAHYASATTMIRGVCTPTSDLNYLPRVPLYERDSAARVRAKMLLAPWA